MKEIKVRISNDSLNCYGTRILTEGMDISQFERNPVLLYMHHRGSVVGQVKNIVKGKNEVTGVLIFDEATDLSKQLKKQYEEGSMRMVSVGVSVLEWSEAPEHLVQGQTSPTVAKSKLVEVSCVDVGANDDAIRLFSDGDVLTLAKDGKNPMPILTKQNKMEITQLALMLGLPETATAEQVKAKIGQLLALAKEFETLKKEKEQLVLSAITSAVDGAVKERRLSAENKAHFIELGKKIGLDELNATLKAMNPAAKLSSQLNTSASAVCYKKLSDVPEAELKAMKENDPAHYASLYKAEYGIDLEH